MTNCRFLSKWTRVYIIYLWCGFPIIETIIWWFWSSIHLKKWYFLGLQCGWMFSFLFLENFEDFRAFDTSCFESSILFPMDSLIFPDSNKFFRYIQCDFFADLRNFLPNGPHAVLLNIFDDDFKTAFLIGSTVLNKELKLNLFPFLWQENTFTTR